jgi:uncharacterized damage-inducible protein DinB
LGSARRAADPVAVGGASLGMAGKWQEASTVERGSRPSSGFGDARLAIVIDELLTRWGYVRGMTKEFLEAASDECLDFRPAADFATIREQASHLSEVQGVYQLALGGEEPDFARKPEFSPASSSVEGILAALQARDRDLVELLDLHRPEQGRFRISWYGTEMTISGFGSVFIQHESLHHGQWATYSALGGYDPPIGWRLNWGL